VAVLALPLCGWLWWDAAELAALALQDQQIVPEGDASTTPRNSQIFETSGRRVEQARGFAQVGGLLLRNGRRRAGKGP
jgi:hypothetical protein